MQVDSFLEIFTTLYGWAWANILGEIFTGTGLFLLPFFVVAINIFRESKESGSGGAAAVVLSEAVQVKVITMIFVFVFCYCTTPLAGLQRLSFVPVASIVDPNPQTATVDNTGTSYDRAMPKIDSLSPLSSSGNLSAVPMWWFFVMAASSGINHSFRAGIDASASNLRDLAALGRLAGVEDSKLKADVNRFYAECYVPAGSYYNDNRRFDKTTMSAESAAIIDPSNKDYGPTDVDWMGSKLFVTDPSFYPNMRSKYPVEGFPADPNNPLYANTSPPSEAALAASAAASATVPSSLPKWDRPTCASWWLDPTNGIRARIVNQSSSNMQKLKMAVSNVLPGSSADEQQDAIARMADINQPPIFIAQDRVMGELPGNGGIMGVVRFAEGTLGAVPTLFASVSTGMSDWYMTGALMMVQAMLLMAVYALLPLIVVLSGYDIKIMLYGGVAIFTLKFWTVLWIIARWMDGNLFTAMYPDLSILSATNAALIVQGLLYKRMILNIVLFSAYVGLPVVWSGMMAWIGVQAGNILSHIMEGNAHPVKTANNTGMKVPIVGKFF